jgi:hypothetical protein
MECGGKLPLWLHCQGDIVPSRSKMPSRCKRHVLPHAADGLSWLPGRLCLALPPSKLPRHGEGDSLQDMIRKAGGGSPADKGRPDQKHR